MLDLDLIEFIFGCSDPNEILVPRSQGTDRVFWTVVGGVGSRFLAIKSILQTGAENGVNLATKVPNLDADIQNLHKDDYDYLMYYDARRKVIEEATKVPLATLVGDEDNPRGALLLSYSDSDPVKAANDTDLPAFSVKAAVLRPGEIVRDEQNAYVDHPTLSGVGGPGGQSPDALMEHHPVVVQLRAKVEMFSPFIPDMIATATAIGYRERIPRAIYPSVIDPDGNVVSVTPPTNTIPEPLAYEALPVARPESGACTPNWTRCMNQSLFVQPACPVFNQLDPGYPPNCRCAPCTPENSWAS